MKAMIDACTRSIIARRRNAALLRTIVIALAILPASCNKDDQPASKPPVAESERSAPLPPQAKPLSDLESLVAPIALYPDPLLAELLVASTYPLEVVQAARWLDTQPDLATLSSKDWDASIMRLVSVPQVVKMMNDHLDWTTQLGDAFLAKPAEVMTSIQTLRKRAMDAGYLKDSPEQKVSAQAVALEQAPEAGGAMVQPAVLQKEVISIKPAKADTVYVPQYPPEVVYQAPLAPPPATTYPASTVVNVNAAPAPSYYPTYPATTTTTTSSSDSWMNFATGAVVGGLLTWGIMEWADDDDYYVGHYYGNSVCHSGNCWYGGGGFYGDRGNVNYNKDINISGNEINIDRGGSFSQSNLRPSQQPTGWRSDPRHRRGQPYPKAAQQRLGRIQQPALAGQRLGASQALTASARGFAEAGLRTSAATLPAERRPSSADIQRQLAQKPGAQPKLAQSKTPARGGQAAQGQRARDTALQGVNTPGPSAAMQSQRGVNSRNVAQTGTAKKPTKAQMPRAQRPQQTARPHAFEAPGNAKATQSFSQRGASSMQRSVNAGNRPSSGARPVGSARGGGGRRR